MVDTGNLATVATLPRSEAGDIAAFETEVQGFFISLRAARRSPGTLRNYRNVLARFEDAVIATGRSIHPASIDRRTIEAYLIAQQDGYTAPDGTEVPPVAPRTGVNRAIVVRGFFRWLVDEGVRTDDPWSRVKLPQAPEDDTPVLTTAEQVALIETTKGTTFLARRDRAIIMFLLDTGVRRAELLGLTVEDVDLVAGEARVTGKGERSRTVRFGDDTTDALRRYLRVRADHPHADLTEARGIRRDAIRSGLPLWLGDPAQSVRAAHRGTGTGHVSAGLKTNAVAAMLNRRCREAGLRHIHPHQFRHTWADAMRTLGAQDGDLMRLGGWRSFRNFERYGRAEADRRARRNYLSPVDSRAALADAR